MTIDPNTSRSGKMGWILLWLIGLVPLLLIVYLLRAHLNIRYERLAEKGATRSEHRPVNFKRMAEADGKAVA